MCAPNIFIEQQAFEMCEKIKQNSVYNFIKVDYSEGSNQGFHSQDENTKNRSALITRVFLEDKDGTQYTVEPNPNGVRFAKGEITYKEYKKLQKRETVNGIATFFGILVFFSGLMYLLMKVFA
ncbi:hypothetical protein P5G62_017895 [Neobacillus sp. 179-C4.2 HS]|uniref:DUF3592 domain-containing protein n=1 Tax=Neobacillus driksii TaxID=3035913 RepID=A0ABV4YXA2_9BACI|nr:hypothetical protein [Neobacillus sp. 179.-C4.2 HS]MDP5192232.1 hypothetical protein [Neobacillus sp. 179.-C4.2 HS]